ncbi:RNase P and RNase MRP subunit [Sporothrix curviconia]|uniref:RNase P and RNase MRP subunit n=1 Tax=Sporothrix curviconia TaxID=1260050 RepID=A0ABP0CTZ9_9PEZI
MNRRKVPELDTPFSSVEWPIISQENQDTILELLCSLLSPVGQHRRDHVDSSRGKRSRRRARQAAKEAPKETGGGSSPAAKTHDARKETALETKRPKGNVPPLPELSRFVDVGLATITRELAKSSAPGASISVHDPSRPASSALPMSTTPAPHSSTPYAAVFVVRSGHPSAFYSHFPQMIAVASQQAAAAPDSPPVPVRLVGFSRACEDRLSASLEIPRVSAIALRSGAPQSQGLLKFLEEAVPTVDVQWLDEAQAGKFRDTRIQIADVRVGPKRKKKA